ncbi:hypothetical protein H6P81_016289 [Aristolochia fimbriata]|uniref:Uncharacterized protein n=1 Tax=Aristolochia fimbriata TaxID=158543 RepID=A0AAV7E8B2_ARIFI|nr:hypothetical protein H6P81_016289 [Aristolochia fimbriata]
MQGRWEIHLGRTGLTQWQEVAGPSPASLFPLLCLTTGERATVSQKKPSLKSPKVRVRSGGDEGIVSVNQTPGSDTRNRDPWCSRSDPSPVLQVGRRRSHETGTPARYSRLDRDQCAQSTSRRPARARHQGSSSWLNQSNERGPPGATTPLGRPSGPPCAATPAKKSPESRPFAGTRKTQTRKSLSSQLYSFTTPNGKISNPG